MAQFLSVIITIIIIGFIWAIISLGLAAVILLVELPIITRCCPTRGPVASLSSFFESVMIRSIGYLVFSIVEFSGVTFTYGLMISPGILLLFVSALYGLALIKGQELKRSVVTGGSGL